jgi:hypothetical protein
LAFFPFAESAKGKCRGHTATMGSGPKGHYFSIFYLFWTVRRPRFYRFAPCSATRRRRLAKAKRPIPVRIAI